MITAVLRMVRIWQEPTRLNAPLDPAYVHVHGVGFYQIKSLIVLIEHYIRRNPNEHC
jgi:hypothetical protein